MNVALPDRTPILGAEISVTNYGEVLRICRRWVEEFRAGARTPGRMVCIVCVHSLMAAVKQPDLRAVFHDADINTPDGMPLVWAMRSAGHRGQRRVYGPNLMLALCGQAARLGHAIYLYGGSTATIELLRQRLESRFPALRIAGAESPPFRELTEAEELEAAERIRRSGAEMVFVGLGAPKQERWMDRMRTRLPGVVMLGVGAAFDFHAGKVRQAPEWIQNHGLEWLFRLAMEPARLWKRYLLVTPWFIPLYALQRLGVLRLNPNGMKEQ